VQVINVDGFQGRENVVIILSLVRANSTGELGFARHQNRLNVALSRARSLLIIVGNLDVFKKHPSKLFKDLMQQLDLNAVVIRE
jgi:superfamily I DNA and/or RNA helicase